MLRQVWALVALKWTLLRHTWHAGRWLVAGAGDWAERGRGGAVAGGRRGPVLSGRGRGKNRIAGACAWCCWTFPRACTCSSGCGGLLLEVQRNDIIDLRRLLHLPVSLRMIYLINFRGLTGRPAACCCPCRARWRCWRGLDRPATTMEAILAPWRPWFLPHPVVWCGALLFACFALMLAAWAHYLRGMLAIVMENKRWRRVVMTLIPVTFIVLGQLPGLLSQLLHARQYQGGAPLDEGALMQGLVWGHLAFPPAWLSMGLWALVRGGLSPGG